MNRKKLMLVALAMAALAAALLPALRVMRILASAGVDVPSNDETGLLSRFLGDVLSGHYNWLHFPRDVIVNGHIVAMPSLVYVLLARFDQLHLYPALFGALLLDFVSLLLFYDAATLRSRGRAPFGAAILLPLIALLGFSVTQMSGFEYPLQAMNAAFGWFGFSIGIWGLTRWPGHTRAIVLVIAGALIASFSYANGITLWLIFPLSMALLGFKRRAHYLSVVLTGLTSIALYAYMIATDHRVAAHVEHVFNPGFVVAGIGRAFANNINSTFAPDSFTLVIGALGLALLALEITVGWKQLRGPNHQEYVPALAIVALGLLSLAQVSMFRTLLAPWYTGLAMNVWIGIAVLAYLLWAEERPEGENSIIAASRRVAPVSILIVLCALWAYSNRSYSDKSFLLKNRAPVSAACMRYFDTAPTYCQQMMAAWSPGRVSSDLQMSSIGPLLKNHALSIFADHQELTLQGDSIMDSVRYLSGPLGSDAGWATGLQPDFKPFTEFVHLNLFLKGTAKVEWTVMVPNNAASASFISAAATPGSAPGRIIPQVHLYDSSGAEQQIFSIALQKSGRWYPFFLPLDQYKGQKVTLRLDAGGGDGWTVYTYPRIEMDVSGPDQSAGIAVSAPSNTDLSPSFETLSQNDYRFDLNAAGQWTVAGLEKAGDDWKVVSPDPSITNVSELNIPVSDYSSLYVKMSASSNQALGSFYAVLVTRTGDELPTAHQLVIPLLADDKMHAYTFPLRMLTFPNANQVRVVGISLHPMHDPGGVPADAWVKIEDCGLIRVREGAR